MWFVRALMVTTTVAVLSAGLGGCASPDVGEIDVDAPAQKETAMMLVSSFENSTTDWRGQYGYLEDIGDGRGYTGGLIGFTSGTGDMVELVRAYSASYAGNPLEPFIPALDAAVGSDSHAGLGERFEQAWAAAAATPEFQAAQDAERDRTYFDPAVAQGKADGLSALGQFAYYDALVVHDYLSAFFDARDAIMREEPAHADTSRVDTAQRVFLDEENFDLERPLSWLVYGEQFSIDD